MRSVFRALAMAAAFAVTVGCGCFAFAKSSSPLHETSWLYEIGQQCLPIPQLLYIQGCEQDQTLRSLISELPEPDEFDIFHPAGVVRDDWYQSSAERINTEAIIMPPATVVVFNGELYHGAVWIRSSYGPPPPVLDLRPPPENDSPFSKLWLRDLRAFPTVSSAAFTATQFDEDNPFQLNIPKRLSIYGDDLRLFEFSLPHITDEAFWYEGAGVCMTLFYRWSLPDQDEMLSTLLHPPQ